MLLFGGSSAFANPSSPGGSPGSWDQGPGKHYGKQGRLDGGPELTPDEAQRLRAAREKAKSDPTIKSLREARDAIDTQIENAMNVAIVSADSSLAPVVEKIKAARGRAKEARDKFESMTPGQKEALKAAREAAKSDPAVVAAREKMKSATDPQAKREAGRAMHEAMKAAMTKQNPSLAPLLEKMGPPPPSPGGPGQDGPPPPAGVED